MVGGLTRRLFGEEVKSCLRGGRVVRNSGDVIKQDKKKCERFNVMELRRGD